MLRALADARAGGIGNSKVGFAAVEIASDLGLDTSAGSNAVKNVQAAIAYLVRPGVTTPPSAPLEWEGYFQETTNLWKRPDFMLIVRSSSSSREDQLGGHRPQREQRLGRPHQRRGDLGASVRG